MQGSWEPGVDTDFRLCYTVLKFGCSLTIRLHEMYDFTSQQAPPSSQDYMGLLLERGNVELCIHLTLVDTIGSMVYMNCHKSWLRVFREDETV